MNSRLKLWLFVLGGSVAGILIGGYAFSDSRPRSILAFDRCDGCLHPNEVIGLLASVAIQHAPGIIPNVVLESERTIAIRHPAPVAPRHFVIFPKKDIKNIGQLGAEDLESMQDLLAVAQALIHENQMKEYRFWTNGPGNQAVAYLHFHLAGE